MERNPFHTVALLESSALHTISQDQLLKVAEDLELFEFAKRIAESELKCAAAIRTIAKVAPVRALGQATLRYEASMGSLSDYLFNATKRWALKLSRSHGTECLPMTELTVAQALEEEGRLMITEEAKEIHTQDPLEVFREVLTEDETIFTQSENRIEFKMVRDSILCDFVVSRWTRGIAVYAYLPVFVPENRRSAVAELLAFANWNMAFGAFEMDPADGQVRYHYSLPLVGEFVKEHARMMISVSTYGTRGYAAAICELALTDHLACDVIPRLKEREEKERKEKSQLAAAQAA
jgi:hypothetical protein